jgi:hypothetical protein
VASQKLEAPGVPIVHTFFERPGGKCELIAFATERAGEGRVDNVVLKVRGARSVPKKVTVDRYPPSFRLALLLS